MTDRATARIARESRRQECARRLRKALHRHDVDQVELAADVGIARSKVQAWCDAGHKASMPLHDVLAAPEPVALDLLRWIAGEMGFRVVSANGDVDLATVHRETSEAIAAALEGKPLSPATKPLCSCSTQRNLATHCRTNPRG